MTVSTGYVIPYCVNTDPKSKRGINCLLDTDVVGAINVLKVINPELTKRAVNFRCSDATVKPFMTEPDIVSFIKTNYAIKVSEYSGDLFFI